MKPLKSEIRLGEDREYTGVDRYRICNLRDLGAIKVVLVSGKRDSQHAFWKEMLEQYHYLHSVKLYGQQLKYLIESERLGWIGAMAFSSASWKSKTTR